MTAFQCIAGHGTLAGHRRDTREDVSGIQAGQTGHTPKGVSPCPDAGKSLNE